MRGNLKAMLQREFRSTLDVHKRLKHQACRFRHINIGLEQPRAVRTECTVQLALNGTDGKEVIVLGLHQVMR